MLLNELIKPEGVLCNAEARSKKHCLEMLSELLVRQTPEITNEQIFENLIKRERLGCTSLGKGVAFPHCRVDGIDRCNGALILLSEPVDFDAPDGEPVDLIFGLMVPETLEDDDSTTIKMVTSILGNESMRSRLRAARTNKDLFGSLVSGSQLAATQCA